ncbi:MAG TPA: DNA mismatch repair endonuclease MutL [Phycisphaerae bacterium]|nr:DNA mismatch repair endonuclease MutL [Phycisphaerae bacterium]
MHSQEYQSGAAKIRRLDPALVNKIAAGEVVERPASVVKELVENALDAGATRIDVALEAGGTDLIRVTDNGRGIARDDLALAIAAHATSKIATSDDLFNIATLGFRGEALASIASVSHLRIVSRTADQVEGYEITGIDERQTLSRKHDVLHDKSNAFAPQIAKSPDRQIAKSNDRQIAKSQISNSQIRPCPAPLGTTVEVRNLFYNVPARRKFLKQPQTECGHVTEQIARLSLAHPGVSFTLTHHARTLRNLPAAEDRRVRIADFYGAELADCLFAVRSQERELNVEGLIAPPAHSRASTKWQYLFLNGRFITDRRIAYAVREAFRGLVEHDRFPVVFLFLTADPRDYDVNVHPTKIEVRWKDAGLVQSQVLGVLREALLSRDLTPSVNLYRAVATAATSYGGIGTAAGAGSSFDPRPGARQALADYLKRVDPTQSRLTFSPPPFRSDSLRPSIAGTLRMRAASCDVLDEVPVRHSSVDEIETPPFVSVENSTAVTQPAPPPALLESSATRSVIQIHNAYLVAQTAEGVIIIDQHALHERILYERFRERILQGPLESQGLLLPEPVPASPARLETAEHFRPLLKKLGVDLAPFGPNTLAVQAFPSLLHNLDIKSFVADLLDKLAETEGAASEETAIHAALDMMACKAAVKAGDPLTLDEMYALLEMRHLTERSSNCPHGRPTTLELTTRDLERQFKRV